MVRLTVRYYSIGFPANTGYLFPWKGEGIRNLILALDTVLLYREISRPCQRQSKVIKKIKGL